MPYITITPVPYNGGTLIAGERRHMCRLTDTRYFCIYGQTGPDLTFGMVVSVDNIRSANPVTTVLRTQTIPELAYGYSQSGFRCARLNDTDILVYTTASASILNINVLRIDATTNVISRVGNTLSETVLANTADFVNAATQGNGTLKAVAENTVMCVNSTSATSASVVRVSWVPGTLVLSKSTVYTFTSLSQNMRTFQFAKSRDTSDWQVSAGSHAAAGGYSTQTNSRAIGDPISGTWTPYIFASQQVFPALLPIDATNAVLMIESNKWKSYAGATQSNVNVQFCTTAAVSTYNKTVFATWLNSDYFMLITSANTSTGQQGWPVLPVGMYIRIVKYTDINYGETSPTTIPNLLKFTDFSMDFSNSSFEYISPDVVLVYGRAAGSNTSFKIGVINSGSL
jgi:hypothetical protein